MRYTARDAENRLRGYAIAATYHGLIEDGFEIELQKGSPTNGRAWRLFVRDPENGALHSAPGSGDRGYIGWTAREAVLVLDALTEAFRAIEGKRS